MKIFQIGFNKCGTISFHKLFKLHANIPSIHWDHGLLAYKIFQNLYSEKHLPLDGYEKYTFFSDMECFFQDENKEIRYISIAQNYFDLLNLNYENSIFILNTRNIDNWIKSRLKHISPPNTIINEENTTSNLVKYVDIYKKIYKTNSIKDITDIWKKEWIEHHDAVQEYFSHSKNFLIIYNIEKDNFLKLKNFFLQKKIIFNTDKFPHEHRTAN
jgi:hypothetical protein